MKKVLLILLVMMCFFVVGCGDDAKTADVTITVTFKDGNDVLATKTIKVGEGISEEITVPEKEEYNFVGWDRSLENFYQDTTVNAIYAKKTFKVVFKLDDTVLKEQIVEYGTDATAPATTDITGFLGWDKAFTNVKSDLEVKVLFELPKYTVNFFDLNNQLLVTKTVAHGEELALPVEVTGYTVKEGYHVGVNADLKAVYSNLDVRVVEVPNTDTPYTIKIYEENTLVDTLNLTGVTDTLLTYTPEERLGYQPEQATYLLQITGDGNAVLDVNYIVKPINYTLELNGGNTKYPTRLELMEEFTADYSAYKGITYTIEGIPLSAWGDIDIHGFFYSGQNSVKYKWMAEYLGNVGSNANKQACAQLLNYTTASAYDAVNSNWKYACAYEFKAFVKGILSKVNANYATSDYADYQLANGFWPTYAKYNEQTYFENATAGSDLPTTIYREGYVFDGWYTTADFQGEKVTTVGYFETYYAKWNPLNPITELNVTNTNTNVVVGDTEQLVVVITPEDAYNKDLVYTTSNDKIAQVNESGLVTFINEGTVTITVTAALTKVTTTIEFNVAKEDSMDVRFEESYNGTLAVGATNKLVVVGMGTLNGGFEFASNNTAIATVSDEGVVTGVAIGVATIEVKSKDNGEILMTFDVVVRAKNETEKVDQLLELLVENALGVVDTVNVSLYYDDYQSFEQYYDAVYGSVNLFLFDQLNLDETTYLIDPVTQTNKTSGIMDSVEFITVHDTANINGGLTAHGGYWKQTTHSTSIHYTVGDRGVIQDMPLNYSAHHAGDGTNVKFEWTDTGVQVPSGVAKPVISISADGYFTFNGTKSSVLAPKGSNGEILDDSYLTTLGPTWKVENGNYYIGTSWFCTQFGNGVISSKGGNLNSIGIEMCVNTSGDIYDTWQRTAKLVAKLMDEMNLDINRVVQHNTFTGKNCPQSLRTTEYWDTFMQMVLLEYTIKTQYPDATITLESSDTTLLSNSGRVVGTPKQTTSVDYTIKVQIGEASREIALNAIIPGTATWDRYDGYFTLR